MERLFQRICCTSREHFDAAVDIVLNTLDKVLENNKNLNEEERGRFKNRFLEHYRKLLTENIIFLNKEEAGNEATDSRDYLNNKLLPKVSDLLIETTRKRKYYPQKCSEIMEKRLKLEREKLKLQRYEVQDDRVKLNSQELAGNSLNIFENEMKVVSSKINNYIQNIQEKIDKVKNYKECIDISQKMKTCRTDQIVFEESVPESNE